MLAQAAARSISEPQFTEDSRIPKPPLMKVVESLLMAVQLVLVKSHGIVEQVVVAGDLGQFLLEARDAVMERQVEVDLHESNQIAAVSAAMAIEQVLRRIDMEGGVRLRV